MGMDLTWLGGFLAIAAAGLYKLVRDDPEVVTLIDRFLTYVFMVLMLIALGVLIALEYARALVINEMAMAGSEADAEPLGRVLAQIKAVDPVLNTAIWSGVAIGALVMLMAWLARRRLAALRRESGGR